MKANRKQQVQWTQIGLAWEKKRPSFPVPVIVNTSTGNDLTCAPGILVHIFAAGWRTDGSFGSEPSAATPAPSSGSWCRPSEICPPWASPGTPPARPWRRSWSCRTGTCPGPWGDDATDLGSKPRKLMAFPGELAHFFHLNKRLQKVSTHKLLVWWHHVPFL